MVNNKLLQKIKTDLRRSGAHLDEDISDQIEACLSDLSICGIHGVSVLDSNILTAVKLWCRSLYDTDKDARAEYSRRYDRFKASLMVAKGYGGAHEE